MKQGIVVAVVLAGALGQRALAEGTPKIQFDQTVYDFGKTSQVENVSGVFKFRNAGDGLLKVEPPKPTCGCTVADLKPDTLKPGETGELSFTLNLGRYRTQLEKRIAVKSNDPQTPELSLTIKADYTPLYSVSSMSLVLNLPLGVDTTNQSVTLTRTDGQPLPTLKLDTSKPWITPKLITPKLEPGAKTDDASVRIRVDVQRDGAPRRFNEYLHVYSTEQTNRPLTTVFLYGQFGGEFTLSPETLYWGVTDPAKINAEHPEALVTRRLTIRSNTGKTFEVKNPKTTLQGVQLEILSKEPGKVYELVARLNDAPTQTMSGNVSFETSVTNQSTIEVPAIVTVVKP